MRTEDLFKYGVTPKDGEHKGERYQVEYIAKDYLDVVGKDGQPCKFESGSYELWSPPKTIFDDKTIKPTWGNLKRAMEEAGLGDDTLFYHEDTFFPDTPARFYLAKQNGKVTVCCSI